MMYSGKKFLLFSLLGILLGYLFHRLTLLYDSYTGNTLDKWTHLLMEGQDEVLQSPWNVSFTGKSSAFFLLGFVMMLLVYLYLETGKKQYREGVEYGSARFGTLKEKKLFYRKKKRKRKQRQNHLGNLIQLNQVQAIKIGQKLQKK